MANTTVQCNTRMEASLKRGGDAVLERCSLSTSDAIRALWSYAVEHQTLPDFVFEYARENRHRKDRAADKEESAAEKAREGRGLALVASGMASGETTGHPLSDETDYESLRDAMYDDMLREMEENCR